jgi:transcription elongation factor SPT5
LSAFTRDTIPGAIYIEALTIDSVNDALHGVAGVIRSPLGPRIDLVPLEDRIPLLKMSGSISDTIKPGAFARLKDRSLYHNDLAVIKEFDPTTLVVRVLLAPRIQIGPDTKRKLDARPPPALFDPKVVKKAHGDDSVKQQNQVWRFKDTIYYNGLVEKDVPFYQLSDRGPKPKPSEIDLFLQSRDPSVLASIHTSGVLLHTQDRIRVIAGTFQGLVGHLLDIGAKTVTIQSDAEFGRQEVYLSEVCRLFQLGDVVDVLYGEKRGAVGYIVDLDGASAVIYVRDTVALDGKVHERPGQEVILAFASTSPHPWFHCLAHCTYGLYTTEGDARHTLLVAIECSEIHCRRSR